MTRDILEDLIKKKPISVTVQKPNPKELNLQPLTDVSDGVHLVPSATFYREFSNNSKIEKTFMDIYNEHINFVLRSFRVCCDENPQGKRGEDNG